MYFDVALTWFGHEKVTTGSKRIAGTCTTAAAGKHSFVVMPCLSAACEDVNRLSGRNERSNSHCFFFYLHQGMELGLRALVAAGAKSVMTLHCSRYFSFQPLLDAQGTLTNAAAFEEFLSSVRSEGTPPVSLQTCILHCLHLHLHDLRAASCSCKASS